MNKNKSLIIIGSALVLLLIGVTTPTKNWYKNSNWKKKIWKTNTLASHNNMTN